MLCETASWIGCYTAQTGLTVNDYVYHCFSMKIVEFKEKLKERRAAEEAEKAKAESSNEVEVEVDAKQTEEVNDTNDESQPEKSEEKPDHSKMNGQPESGLQNGDTSIENEEEAEGSADQSEINNSISPKEVIVAGKENLEPALVNGEEKKATEEVMPEEKQAEN